MERGTFAEIDHTADLGLDLAGPDPAAILEAAQRGLTRLLLGDVSDLTAEAERTVTVSAADHPELLKDWCERLYALLEQDGFVALETRVERAEPGAMRAVVAGARPGPDRVAAASELKAVTYHQLEFAPAATGGWRARIIFDV